MKFSNLSLVFIVCLSFLACKDFLEEQSQDLTYAASCEDLNEILIGSGYMGHRYVTSIDLRDGASYYPWIHVMDDDIEEFTYGSSWGGYMGKNADDMKSFYYWEKAIFQNNGNIISDYEWERLYRHIASLNVIIKEVDNFPHDPEKLRHKILGESMFLRAGYYWLLANFYAAPYEKEKAKTTLGVPLKLTEYIEDKIYHRTTLDSVYHQIITDLRNASNYLDGIEQPSVYRANKDAAHALLGRVYLYMGEWQAALEECNKISDKYSILDLNGFSAEQDFLSSSSSESIFIQGISAMTSMFSRDRGTVSYRVSDSLLNIYEPSDLRKKYFFKSYKSGVQNCVVKIIDTETRESSGSDVFMIRYPEIILNKAEALAMLGNEKEAIKELEKLLVKRYKDHNFTAISAEGENLVNFIRTERRKEFCFEGHRWFDLRRYSVSPKYPLKTIIKHTVFERNPDKVGLGDIIGYYELLPWPDGKGWILPIPTYELEMSGTKMIDNERENAKYYEIKQ